MNNSFSNREVRLTNFHIRLGHWVMQAVPLYLFNQIVVASVRASVLNLNYFTGWPAIHSFRTPAFSVVQAFRALYSCLLQWNGSLWNKKMDDASQLAHICSSRDVTWSVRMSHGHEYRIFNKKLCGGTLTLYDRDLGLDLSVGVLRTLLLSTTTS